MQKSGTLLLALAAVSACAQPAKPDYNALIGKWRVSGVSLARAGGVQALVENDPHYVGAELEFTAQGIAWRRSADGQPLKSTTDDCHVRPQLTPADDNDPDTGYQVEGGFNVLCGADAWGPGAVIKPLDGKTAQLYWYDNGILTLTRLR